MHPEFIGQSPDEALSETGVAQAHLLRERLKEEKLTFKEVYCSPYKRAQETCRLALPDQEITLSEELREYSTGDAEDKSRAEMITFDTLCQMKELGMHFGWPGGETLFEVQKRASKWLYDVMTKYKDQYVNIAAFSHGITLKTLIQHIMGFEQRLTWRLTLNNTALSVFDYKLDHWFVKTINDTSHLPYHLKENNP